MGREPEPMGRALESMADHRCVAADHQCVAADHPCVRVVASDKGSLSPPEKGDVWSNPVRVLPATRRHKGRRPRDGPRHCLPPRFKLRREVEVHHVRLAGPVLAPLNHDVSGLDITVNKPGSMRARESERRPHVRRPLPADRRSVPRPPEVGAVKLSVASRDLIAGRSSQLRFSSRP